jgi:hypothetical protein
MLTGAGLARTWPHDRAHAFFSRAAWSPDTLGVYLSRLIVRTLLPEGVALTVAIDDTLFKNRGRTMFGAAWQHDGAARSQKPVGYGCCFVVAGIIVELPLCTRPVCLPMAARLSRPRTGTTKVEITAALVQQPAAWNATARRTPWPTPPTADRRYATCPARITRRLGLYVVRREVRRDLQQARHNQHTDLQHERDRPLPPHRPPQHRHHSTDTERSY